MDRSRKLLFLLLACTLFAGTAFAAEKTAKSYQKLQKEIDAVVKATDKFGSVLKDTTDSLSQLSGADGKKLDKAVKSFRKDAENLSKILTTTTARIENLNKTRSQYFAEWERSTAAISNPDLKKAAEDRRAKIIADHENMTAKASGLRTRIEAFATELADLQLFLGNDPNPGAVATAQPTIDEVVSAGNTLSAEVLEVSRQLAGFARGLS